jgi:hypothetical protein
MIYLYLHFIHIIHIRINFSGKLKNKKAALLAYEEDVDWCLYERNNLKNESLEAGDDSEVELHGKIDS